jgi:NADPH:quinone reductase-like Zn-dependent oxidoreductase
VPVNYLTASLALYRMAALAPGETVLVHNAGGGVGIAATQLARLRRATVIGTASAFKHDALRSFGVDHAIDYRHANVADEVKKITRGRGVDVILDPIGGRSFTESYRMLAPLGRLIIFGLSAAAPGRTSQYVARVPGVDVDASLQPDVDDQSQPGRLWPSHRTSVG